MALLDALGTVLQTASVGTLATSIFLSRSPDTPDACVTVYESGSGETMYTHGTAGAALNMTNVQVVCRGAREDYPTARSKVDAVIAAFEAVNETTTDGVRLLRIEKLGQAIPMGYDDNDRPSVAINFRVTHG